MPAGPAWPYESAGPCTPAADHSRPCPEPGLGLSRESWMRHSRHSASRRAWKRTATPLCSWRSGTPNPATFLSGTASASGRGIKGERGSRPPRFLIDEYDAVKPVRHPKFRLVSDFYAHHRTNRQTFLKCYVDAQFGVEVGQWLVE